MKIEIVEVKSNSDYDFDTNKLSIDGEIDLSSTYFAGSLSIENKSFVKKISSLSIDELCKYFTSVSFRIEDKVAEWNTNCTIELQRQEYVEDADGYPIESSFKVVLDPKVQFRLGVNPRDWNKLYTIEFLSNLYFNVSKEFSQVKFDLDSEKHFDEGLIGSLYFEVSNKKIGVSHTIDDFLQVYEKINLKVLELLKEVSIPDVFTTLFEFPDIVKTSCKQYLIYFAQFLADLGIDVDTSIKEKTNKVLFTVTPKDGNEALSVIKEALEVYMNAPSNPNIEILTDDPKDISVLQWEANMFHLKSQIALQQAVLQTKDATIEALQLSNYRLKEDIITANQIEEKASSSKEEKFMGGTVAIKKYDGKWFSVNLPEIIRKLKRKK